MTAPAFDLSRLPQMPSVLNHIEAAAGIVGAYAEGGRDAVVAALCYAGSDIFSGPAEDMLPWAPLAVSSSISAVFEKTQGLELDSAETFRSLAAAAGLLWSSVHGTLRDRRPNPLERAAIAAEDVGVDVDGMSEREALLAILGVFPRMARRLVEEWQESKGRAAA